MISCEFCKISKNTFFTEYLWAPASTCTLLQNAGTCLYRIWESNVLVFPVHLLRVTCFSFCIIMYKRKKACEYLPVFQLSLTKFCEIQKQLKKKKKQWNFRTYWRLTAKVFQWSSLKLTISWETIYSISPRKLSKILWKSFLVNNNIKNSIQSLKQNLTHFPWNTLLYPLCNNKAKIWACCCCKAWIAWLCWAWICLFCIMSWLCCHSRASLSMFCSCQSFDLNSQSCSSFPRRKPTTS